MNPSAYSSACTAATNYHCTPTSVCYDAHQTSYSYPDYVPGGLQSALCSSGAMGEYSEAYPGGDRELYGTFLAVEVASASPSGPGDFIPMQYPLSHDLQPSFLHPTEAVTVQFHSPSIGGSQFPSYAAHSVTLASVFRQAPLETTAPCISPDLVYPNMHRNHVPENGYSVTATTESSHAALRNSPYSPYPSPPPEPRPNTSGHLIPCRRRNSPVRSATATSLPTMPWHCPHCSCVQHSRRSPDLKRHIHTHTRGAHVAVWVCCGVPALNAMEFGVPAEVVREAPIFEFNGMPMIGGCRKTFSRKDALMRHLRKGKGKCYGDADSMYQPGNRTAE